MPVYFLECLDKPDMGSLRQRYVAEHRQYLAANSDVVKLAGPLGGDGETCGSLIVLECASLKEARAFAQADPFAKAGLFESVVIRELKVETGEI